MAKRKSKKAPEYITVCVTHESRAEPGMAAGWYANMETSHIGTGDIVGSGYSAFKREAAICNALNDMIASAAESGRVFKISVLSDLSIK